jgi:hypothetical protein
MTGMLLTDVLRGESPEFLDLASPVLAFSASQVASFVGVSRPDNVILKRSYLQ